MMSAGLFLLAALIVYVPNAGNFVASFGIMGLNMFNVLFLLAAAAVFLERLPARQPLPRPPLTGILFAYYAVMTLALLIAVLRSTPHLIDDLVKYKTVIHYSLLYFLAYYSVRNLSQIRGLLVLIIAVFTVAAFDAIFEGLEYIFSDFDYQRRSSGPFGEDAGNSNFAGVFYAIFSTFCLAIALLGKTIRFRWRVLAMACYGIGCFAILATFSRQTFLIIGVTTLLLAFRKNPLIAAAAIAFMLAYPLWAPEAVIDRIEMTQQRSATGEEVLEASAASRYELWSGALQIIKKNPAGVGLNQFNHNVEPYLPEWIEARDAQNQYLRWTAEAGIQGGLVFILLLVSFLRLGRRVSRLQQPPEAAALGTAFLLSALAVCMGNIFSSTFGFGEIMANFWIMAGLMARYAVLAEQTETAVAVTPADEIRRIYARWQQPGRELRQ